MSSVECIVPWLGDCAHRERAWRWVRARLPYPVRIADGGVPWVKACAMRPIEASDAEILVVHDADVWHPGLADAVRAVQEGAAWAIPHRGVFRLTEAGTDRLLAGEENFEGLPLEQAPYVGLAGGGIVIARRETLLDIPLDPRFVGWGGEDVAWGLALDTLAGLRWRGKGPLVHLYHPSQERMDRRYGSPAEQRLRQRYHDAADKPESMRSLIEEIHAARNPAQPDVLDRDPAGVG